MILRVLALLAGLMLLTTLSSAGCEPRTTTPELEVLGLYYVDYDDCDHACPPWLWIYEESNGVPGLQRDDEMQLDTCGYFPGDTLVS